MDWGVSFPASLLLSIVCLLVKFAHLKTPIYFYLTQFSTYSYETY